MNRLVCLVLLLGVAGGCGSSASDAVGGRPNSGMTGGTGSTRPECGALNQGCMGQGLDAPIALGSTLEITLDYKIAGTSGPPTTIESANLAVLTSDGKGRVSGVGEGLSAVLFVGPDKAVIDFLHVWVARPEELRINRFSSSGVLLGRVQDSVKLLVGDEVLVSIETYGKGQPLLGNYPLEYDLSGTSVAIVPDPVGGWYRVVARAAGTGAITFKALGLTKTWNLEVLP